MEFHAQCTLFGEGCRGQLSKQLMKHFDLQKGREKQIYGIGIKELWQVRPEAHKPGRIEHTGKFIQEPIISISLNFPAKKYVHFAIWSENLMTCGLRVFLQIICQQKTHPEKNWREF